VFSNARNSFAKTRASDLVSPSNQSISTKRFGTDGDKTEKRSREYVRISEKLNDMLQKYSAQYDQKK